MGEIGSGMAMGMETLQEGLGEQTIRDTRIPGHSSSLHIYSDPGTSIDYYGIMNGRLQSSETRRDCTRIPRR